MEPLGITTFMATAGFTIGEILKMLMLVGINFLFIGALMWKFKRPIIEFFATVMTAMRSMPEMQKSIDTLNKTMLENNIQIGLKLDTGDERFNNHEQRIKRLETHVGFGKE